MVRLFGLSSNAFLWAVSSESVLSNMIIMGCNIRKRTFVHVRLTENQINLPIGAVWSVFAVHI